jgi:hypothetical protein
MRYSVIPFQLAMYENSFTDVCLPRKEIKVLAKSITGIELPVVFQ